MDVVWEYCRFCANLISDCELLNICKHLELLTKVCKYLQLEITDEDQNKKLCSDCLSKLNLINNFIEQVNSAQSFFLNQKQHVEEKTNHEIKDESSDFDPDWTDNFDDLAGKVDIDDELENATTKQETSLDEDTPPWKIQVQETEEHIEHLKSKVMEFLTRYKKRDVNSSFLTDSRYNKFIKDIKNSKKNKRFELLECDDGTMKLIVPRSKSDGKIIEYLPESQMFDCIRKAHLECDHGGRRPTEAQMRLKYKNIQRDLIACYINECRVCQQKLLKYKPGKRDGEEAEEKYLDNSAKEKAMDDEITAWKCSVCDEMLSSVALLRLHFQENHKKKECEYFCLKCSKVYTKYVTFRNHLFAHKQKLRFQCSICHKFCSSRSKLKDHKERHNTNRKRIECSDCGKGFLGKQSLEKHRILKHSNDKSVKWFQCDECDKKFITQSLLDIHKKIHSGIRDHICEQCGKGFICKKYLDEHLLCHTVVRPFKCDICSSSFKSKKHLRTHTQLHTEMKRFQCHLCGKKFLRRAALAEHSMTHTDNFPFKCDICEKGFRRKNCLIRHYRQHTGEKPYSCVPCNRHFTSLSNCNSHMKRIHGIINTKKRIKG